MRDKCQRFVGRNKAVSHGDCVKSSSRTLFPTIMEHYEPTITGVNRRMGTHLETGPATPVLEDSQPTTCPGADRLQGAGQQSIDQAQGGTWVVLYIHPAYGEYWDEWFYTYASALIRWRETGGYLCKNHTPA